MGFFSPWFLAGLLALGLPLWLHLLRQFKRTPQPFSSLMFFERQVQSSSKHRRLRYLTLLLLRLALLLLLALLFANPFINRASSAIAPRQLTVIAMDRSFSMRFQNRFSDAKAQAVQYVKQMTGGEAIQLDAVDSHTSALTHPEKDKAVLIDAIQSMEQTDDASSYGEFARALRVMRQSSGLKLNVQLFTDAQQTSLPAAFSDLQSGSDTSLTIHEIGSGASPNWAVQSVSVAARVYDASLVRLTAAVAGWQTPEASRKLSVLLDGRTIASKDVTIPASGRTEVEFNGLNIPFGVHHGEVRMEPHDDLAADDSFPFSIEHADPRKVLFLTTPGRAAEGFFYKSALDASIATGLRVQLDSFDSASRLDLSSYALIVLNNPGEIEQQTLSDYVLKGGSVLVAVGPATIRVGVIPLSGDRVSSTKMDQGAQVQARDFDRVQFSATPRITPKPADRILARFTDGSPLLLEQTKGEGKVMMFASALDNSTSDFPIHSGYLPFVAATSSDLAGEIDGSPNMTVGSAVALRQSKNQSTSADVIGPDGKHEFPLSDATRIMSFNPPREGFYDVHSANGKRRLLAVHADRRESNLEKIPAETLILWRNTSSGGTGSESNAPGTPAGSSVVQVSLWRTVLIFVLAAAFVESIFATRYLVEKRQAS